MKGFCYCVATNALSCCYGFTWVSHGRDFLAHGAVPPLALWFTWAWNGLKAGLKSKPNHMGVIHSTRGGATPCAKKSHGREIIATQKWFLSTRGGATQCAKHDGRCHPHTVNHNNNKTKAPEIQSMSEAALFLPLSTQLSNSKHRQFHHQIETCQQFKNGALQQISIN